MKRCHFLSLSTNDLSTGLLAVLYKQKNIRWELRGASAGMIKRQMSEKLG